MTLVKDIYDYINAIAPFDLAEKWDNCGLLIGDTNKAVERVMVVLDITDNVIDEAIEKNVDLIVVHHPVIFDPLKQVLKDSLVYRLVKSEISVIAAHTNLDLAYGGVDDALANKLGLKNIKNLTESQTLYGYKIVVFVPKQFADKVHQAMSDAGAGKLGLYSNCAFLSEGKGSFLPLEGSNAFLGKVGEIETVDEVKVEMICERELLNKVIKAIYKSHPYEQPAFDIFENQAIAKKVGIGKIGELETELSEGDFANMVKACLNCDRVRVSFANKSIKKVATCCGSGGSYFKYAVKMGADAFVSGDIKHDIMVDCKKYGITVIDAGHFETENIIIEILQDKIYKKFDDIIVEKSKENKCPYKYV